MWLSPQREAPGKHPSLLYIHTHTKPQAVLSFLLVTHTQTSPQGHSKQEPWRSDNSLMQCPDKRPHGQDSVYMIIYHLVALSVTSCMSAVWSLNVDPWHSLCRLVLTSAEHQDRHVLTVCIKNNCLVNWNKHFWITYFRNTVWYSDSILVTYLWYFK